MSSDEVIVKKSHSNSVSWRVTIPSRPPLPVPLEPRTYLELASKELRIFDNNDVVVVEILEPTRVAIFEQLEPRNLLLVFYFPKKINKGIHIGMQVTQIKRKGDVEYIYPDPLICRNSRRIALRRALLGERPILYWPCEVKSLVKKCDVMIDLQFEIEETVEPTNPKIEALSDSEPSLIQVLQDLHLSEDSSDITIICDDEKFPCHKFILSSRSDVFKTMLAMPDSKEQQDGVISIDDVSAKTMRTFLKFMYKDDLEIEEIDCNLLMAAEKYNFKKLFNICLKQVTKMIKTDTVMEIIIAAYLIDNDQLLQEASKFIFKNRGSIRKCELWDQIKSKHPAIAAKVMDLIVFDEE